nr:NfeD family protein [Pseudohoeflea sp. DP4N28-3]
MELGPWSWWIAGFLLLGAEILIPGIFLLWIGLAAIVVGALSFALWQTAIWNWQIQFLVFAVLALVFALLGRRIMAGRGEESDQPMLNKRAEALVGRTGDLAEPIENGRGRMRIDDTIWVVCGPDLPAGQSVRVRAVEKGDLHVEPV